MAKMDPPSPEQCGLAVDSPFTRTRLAVAILVVLAMLAGVSAIYFQAPDLVGAKKVLTDYDAFHVAGLLALEGRADTAYRIDTMLDAQKSFTGSLSFMPWTYPPPFTLFVAALATLPVGLGFLLFVTTSFAAYLAVLRRIAGPYLPGVLIAMLPTLLLMMRTGQNGFLTASLIGVFLLAFFQRRPGAGLPLGLMVIKPHLAVGITLATLIGRRWHAVLIAAITVIVLLALSTWALGLPVWQGFLDGIVESGGYLRRGIYPLFRMTSIYAFVHTLGAGPDVAMALHGIGALCAAGALLWLWKIGTVPRRLAAAICCVSLFVSPYNYDYDLTVFGLAIAFVLPDILQRTSQLEQTGLVLLCWIATGYGLGRSMTMAEKQNYAIDDPRFGGDELSLMAPLLLLLILLAVRILARPVRNAALPGPMSEAVRPA